MRTIGSAIHWKVYGHVEFVSLRLIYLNVCSQRRLIIFFFSLLINVIIIVFSPLNLRVLSILCYIVVADVHVYKLTEHSQRNSRFFFMVNRRRL